jgi:hypothetical protein
MTATPALDGNPGCELLSTYYGRHPLSEDLDAGYFLVAADTFSSGRSGWPSASRSPMSKDGRAIINRPGRGFVPATCESLRQSQMPEPPTLVSMTDAATF